MRFKRTEGKSGKRILLLLPEVFDAAGGIQMFCRSLCLAAGRWAVKNDASASALVLNDTVRPDPRYVNGELAEFATHGRRKREYIGAFLRRVIRSRHDLLVCGHVALAPLCLAARIVRPGIKTAVVVYGVEVWRPLSYAESLALKRADVVLAISEFTRDTVVEKYSVAPDKLKLFPCALDPYWTPEAAEAAPAQPATPMLLTVGRLESYEQYKGVDSVIESLPAVLEACGPVDYRVVGSGDDIPRLKELAERHGVAEYVTFTGGVGEEELRDYYRRCSLFVMPSEKEGFGIVFLEAMAYAKPVIGGAHGGTPSVIKDGETGLLVERTDVGGISRALISLLNSEELRGRLGEAGRRRLLDEFTFEKFERNFDEFVRSCL